MFRPLLAAIALLLALPAAAAISRGSAVFGSFTYPDTAESVRQTIESTLRLPARVAIAQVRGQWFHRVQSAPVDEREGRAIVEQAKAAGYSAWYLPGTSADVATPLAPERLQRPATPAPETAQEVAPPVPAAPLRSIAATLPADSASTAHVLTPGGGGTETNNAIVQASLRRDVAPVTAPATAPETLTLVTGDEKFPRGERAHIVVTRFDKVNIKIDGIVDEAEWQSVPVYDEMLVIDPDTLEAPAHQTLSRFLFTPRGLYVSAVMEQPAETLVARLSSRDEFINRDSYGITLDTSGEGLYGYWFVVNLGGSVMDGKVAPERSFTNQWDGPWRSQTARIEGGWSMEMFLPWSMMSMPAEAENREMGFWVNRKVAYRDERFSWPPLPFGSSRFMSALATMSLPEVRPTQQWAVFPYASTAVDEINGDTDSRAGFDFFWRPSSNLQLTAAAYPDFGAVESDDVVVNLSAFETFFPEKRLFFLEGNEVFITSPRANPRSGGGPGGSGGRRAPSTFTNEPTTMMNTRRIGGAPRHITIPDDVTVAGIEASKPTDLLGALKVVGQSGGLRYGALGAFEDDVELSGTDDASGTPVRITGAGRDFGVARAIYETSGNGRKSLGYMGTVVNKPDDKSVVHGIDAHMLSGSGKVQWDTQFLYSDVDNISGQGVYSDIRWTPETGRTHSLSLDYLDDSLNLEEFGFLRRNDLVSMRYNFMVSGSRGLPSWLRNQRRALFFMTQANTAGRVTRAGVFAFGSVTFANNSELRGELDWFAPEWDDRNSRDNGIFKTKDRTFGFLSYGSNSAKPLSVSVQGGWQGEDQGGTSYFADIGFTWQPYSGLSFDFDYRYKERYGWLIHQEDRDFTTFKGIDLQPRFSMDYFITARQHLRLTLQWAGIRARQQNFYQVPLSPGELVRREPDPGTIDDFTISRLTTQLRYRWELGPLSDLFVVYTRGSNLDNRIGADFDELLEESFNKPIVDIFVVKLRYRFGS